MKPAAPVISMVLFSMFVASFFCYVLRSLCAHVLRPCWHQSLWKRSLVKTLSSTSLRHSLNLLAMMT